MAIIYSSGVFSVSQAYFVNFADRIFSAFLFLIFLWSKSINFPSIHWILINSYKLLCTGWKRNSLNSSFHPSTCFLTVLIRFIFTLEFLLFGIYLIIYISQLVHFFYSYPFWITCFKCLSSKVYRWVLLLGGKLKIFYHNRWD